MHPASASVYHQYPIVDCLGEQVPILEGSRPIKRLTAVLLLSLGDTGLWMLSEFLILQYSRSEHAGNSRFRNSEITCRE